MNVQEAARWFEANDVPGWMYTVGNLAGGESEGIDFLDGRRTVYCSERGYRHNRVSFEGEEAMVACWIERVNRYLYQAGRRSMPRP